MNESFIHHVVRVALTVGVVMGIGLFSLLLYVSDFWNNRLPEGKDEPARMVSQPEPGGADVPQDVGQRAVNWMFGLPNPEPPIPVAPEVTSEVTQDKSPD